MNISFLVFSLAPFNFASFSCDRLRAHLESTRVEYLEIYLKLTAAVVVAIVVVATLVAVDVVVVSIFLRPVTRINFVMELFARLLYERMQQAGLDECGDSASPLPATLYTLSSESSDATFAAVAFVAVAGAAAQGSVGFL